MIDPASLRFTGPLAPYFVGYWSDLMRQGYTPNSGANLLYGASALSRWLERRALGVGDLTTERAAKFAAYRRRRGDQHFRTPQALRSLLGYLRSVGVAPPAAPTTADTPADRLISKYAEYLASERGLAASTICGYTYYAKRFLADRPDRGSLKWKRLRPADITSFVLREARRWSVVNCKHVVNGLRSLLRYLHVVGQIRTDLASCVPAVAGWRLAWLPKALEPDQARRVLASFDPKTISGRRDAAIVRLLLRLGLRLGDVVMLTLDDINWQVGEITLRGKGRRESHLPLPRDVGRALIAYLRVRPRTSSRRVFLSIHAPRTPLTSGGVNHAAARALRRAGVAAGGTHVLRHTAATQMLRHGASLPEIAHVLRHRHIDTTAIYAKVDFVNLRPLAQPWPGGAV